MLRSRRSLVLLGCLVVSASRLAAQDRPAAKLVTIQGIVVDDDHAPVPSAEVGLTLNGMKPVLVRSGNDGRFTFSDVPLVPGKLTIRRMGYRVRTITLDMFKVGAGEPLRVVPDDSRGEDPGLAPHWEHDHTARMPATNLGRRCQDSGHRGRRSRER